MKNKLNKTNIEKMLRRSSNLVANVTKIGDISGCTISMFTPAKSEDEAREWCNNVLQEHRDVTAKKIIPVVVAQMFYPVDLWDEISKHYHGKRVRFVRDAVAEKLERDYNVKLSREQIQLTGRGQNVRRVTVSSVPSKRTKKEVTV